MLPDRLGKRRRVDHLTAFIGRLQHLQVPPRQQLARLGNVAGIAGELDAVFGGAERRRADAFAGRQHRPRQGAGIELAVDRFA